MLVAKLQCAITLIWVLKAWTDSHLQAGKHPISGFFAVDLYACLWLLLWLPQPKGEPDLHFTQPCINKNIIKRYLKYVTFNKSAWNPSQFIALGNINKCGLYSINQEHVCWRCMHLKSLLPRILLLLPLGSVFSCFTGYTSIGGTTRYILVKQYIFSPPTRWEVLLPHWKCHLVLIINHNKYIIRAWIGSFKERIWKTKQWLQLNIAKCFAISLWKVFGLSQ